MKGVLGDPLPPGDEHGVSVLLPTWEDTLGWASRNPMVLACLKAGYPRFFIPHVVNELATELLERIPAFVSEEQNATSGCSTLSARPARLAILLPCYRFAEQCRRFLLRVAMAEPAQVQIFSVDMNGSFRYRKPPGPDHDYHPCELYAVAYPERFFLQAKSFWQHTGRGISSRYAAYWLENTQFLQHSRLKSSFIHSQLPIKEADRAKALLRKRIASFSSTDTVHVRAEDVYLYPTGMSSVCNTADMLQKLANGHSDISRVAVFGFLYVDTFKILSKVYGFEYSLYGHASLSELDQLESELASGTSIKALYTEFPGNPLLRSPDLKRLHELSNKYDFILVVDDTVGTFVNVALFPFCDILCTSLTKMFSGACNVMGGSLVLNPISPHYESMQSALSAEYVDTYFPLDVLVMEANSRDFALRVHKASSNAETIIEMLRQHPTVREVFYPRGDSSQHIYDSFMRPCGKYGFLLSATFVSPECAIAFHDALDVAKGPSLGTNFTLACAYTLLAHYNELEWAAKFGVVEHLVRISVGVENEEWLVETVRNSLAAAGRLLGLA